MVSLSQLSGHAPRILAAIGTALLTAGQAASATTIDFGALAGAPLFTPFESLVEDGYSIDVGQGQWVKSLTTYGNPGPSVETFGNAYPWQLVITAVGGRSFLFSSVDLNSTSRGPSSVNFTLAGDIFGAQQFSQSGRVLGDGPLSPFQTITSAAPLVEINRLIFTFNDAQPGVPRGSGTATVDNIVLLPVPAPVPEPGTWLLAAVGAAAVLGAGRRRRQG